MGAGSITVTLDYKEYTIELFDEQLHGNEVVYDNIYQPEKGREYQPVSQTGIIVYKDGVKISSALLLAVAGATSVSTDSVCIHNDNLLTRCCNIIFSLSLPGLKLNWMTEADWATCFSIYPYKDDFITHGEVDIARIDANGKIIWQFSGADIFVNLKDDIAFEMYDNHIALTDFNGGKYTIDYDGNEIVDAVATQSQTKTANNLNESKKPWWKFW